MPRLIVLLILLGVTPLLGQEKSSRAVLIDIVQDEGFKQVDGIVSANLRVRIGKSDIPIVSIDRAFVRGRVVILLDSSTSVT
jgi:hypothetical protein